MSRATNAYDLPDVEIGYSWRWALAESCAYLVLTLLCLSGAPSSTPGKHDTTRVVIGYACTILFGFGAFRLIPILLSPQRPVIFIGRLGIRDTRTSNSMIPWQSIEAISLRGFRNQTYILLKLDPAVARLFYAKSPRRLLAAINRWFGGNGLAIDATGLTIRAAELLEICNTYRSAARGSITANWR